MSDNIKTKTSEAQLRASKKYDNEKVYNVRLRVPIEKKDLLVKCAEANNETVNKMLNRLIDEEIKKNNIK